MFLIVNFIPWLVALSRDHKSKLAIFISSLFFNWTLIGWVLNLIWACNSNTKN
ncbi:TPA: superinfection immunity protein [Enterobacter hormaechei]